MASPISVVMRSMNDAAVIGDTLRGVYNQNYPDGVRLIPIDSGSTDEWSRRLKAKRAYGNTFAAVRFSQRRGKLDGYRAGWKRYGRDAA